MSSALHSDPGMPPLRYRVRAVQDGMVVGDVVCGGDRREDAGSRYMRSVR
jgi:hypothetical protein